MNQIFYQETGNGSPLVFLHGFCESHEIWRPLISDLSAQYKIIAIDLPGFGKSGMPPGHISIRNVAHSIIDLLISLRIEKCVLIGHSLGGYVALAMADERQDMFAGLCLFHSTAKPDPEEKKQNRNKTIEFVRKNGPLPFIETFVPGLFFKRDQNNLEEVHRMAIKTSKEAILSYSEAMRDRSDMTVFLKKFEAPVLFIAGTKDSIISVSSLEEQSKISDKGKIVVLDEAGHMGMYEHTVDSIKALKDFATACFPGVRT